MFTSSTGLLPGNRWSRRCAALLLLSISAAAWPQAHVERFGDYVVRSSTVSSMDVPAGQAYEHGIERKPLRAVLNVTVLKDGKTLPAEVDVEAQNLIGRRRPIPMRETRAAGAISYLGSYEHAHGEVLDFVVEARPQDGSGKRFTMRYRDRMWGRGDLPDRW